MLGHTVAEQRGRGLVGRCGMQHKSAQASPPRSPTPDQRRHQRSWRRAAPCWSGAPRAGGGRRACLNLKHAAAESAWHVWESACPLCFGCGALSSVQAQDSCWCQQQAQDSKEAQEGKSSPLKEQESVSSPTGPSPDVIYPELYWCAKRGCRLWQYTCWEVCRRMMQYTRAA